MLVVPPQGVDSVAAADRAKNCLLGALSHCIKLASFLPAAQPPEWIITKAGRVPDAHPLLRALTSPCERAIVRARAPPTDQRRHIEDRPCRAGQVAQFDTLDGTAADQ
jgi:hypothetical protein